jgi:hypothetical protein
MKSSQDIERTSSGLPTGQHTEQQTDAKQYHSLLRRGRKKNHNRAKNKQTNPQIIILIYFQWPFELE